jgi:pimeloyl-ACP methyl ester carboxylesterase
MNSDSYKYIDINGVSIAYKDSGQGQTILFVHGFASFSFTWQKMLEFFPEDARIITIDLKGYGYSEKKCDDHLSPFDQSRILAEFIEKLDLKDIFIVAHSMGGAISLLGLFNPKIEARVKKLVLIDTAGLFQKIPDFIDDLTVMSTHNPLLRLTDVNLISRMVLETTYYDKRKISDELIKEYADILRLKNAKECLIESAKQIAIANIRSFHKKMAALNLPTLLIWGEEDKIIDLEDAFLFFHDLSKAKLKIIPECGHCPQEEQPEETAKIIGKFLHIKTEKKEVLEPEEAKKEIPISAVAKPDEYDQKLKMSRLIDHWSIGTVTLMAFVKCLQFLKKIGFKAEEGGWRKATGIFLRKEHTKFILATFRLHYFNKTKLSPNIKTSKKVLIKRLAKFLHKTPACHWTNDAGFFMNKRKKVFFTDITEVTFADDGKILELVPHFDEIRPTFAMLTPEVIAKALKEIIFECNRTCNLKDPKRARKIHKKLSLWVMLQYNLSRSGQQELRLFINRIMNGTFIQFETITDDPESALKERLATPNTQYRRHPGFGLLNIFCRFTNNLSEADLWFQYHHVPVDGMPMQEMLHELKKEWGTCGQIQYPALSSPAAEMELYDFGDDICRARMYTCLDEFLKLRKQVNEKYYSQMGGPATVASMLIWGLSQHKDLRTRKFLFPVDTSLLVDYPQDRSISLVIIRPGKFFDENKPGKGFIEYQREFNRHLFATRLGKSETYELLELYALIHPFFYYFASKIMPKAMGELIGTAGLTILRDADMFISPMTDIHFNGFIAIGNMKMPTEDGKNACAISFCGNKERVLQYADAIKNLCGYCENLLDDPAEN